MRHTRPGQHTGQAANPPTPCVWSPSVRDGFPPLSPSHPDRNRQVCGEGGVVSVGRGDAPPEKMYQPFLRIIQWTIQKEICCDISWASQNGSGLDRVSQRGMAEAICPGVGSSPSVHSNQVTNASPSVGRPHHEWPAFLFSIPRAYSRRATRKCNACFGTCS